MDLVIINETHFGERSRSPKGFILIGRSTKVESKIPRGGVAIFKNSKSDVDIDILSLAFKDCVYSK